MKKTLHRVATACLALAMVVSSLNFGFVVKAADVEKYTIYPTPQQVEYGTSKTTLTQDVNVVYEANIDQFTKQHVVDVFDLLGIRVSTGLDVDSAKTNVLVGINGQEGLANTYFAENNLVNGFDFTKYDASILSIKDNTIAILAKDTDAAFHAITSLKHIFTQVQNKEVTDLTIRDYADVKNRGFIEGYYGNPWSNEDRADLMTFGGDYKLNNYIYAPKDDPKHNAQWRSLYSEDELAEISKLAAAGNASKCYYVYALHTFMHNAVRFDEANYKNDLKVIQDKFEQLMDAGVKQFAILADDAGVPDNNANNYVTLMTDMTNWMKEKAKTVEGLKTDIIFCPNDYMGWGTSGQMQTLKKLPDSVSIIQTGGKVWGEVGPNFNDSFYSSMGRPAYMWINWPCSDNTKDALIMGGAEKVLKPNVNPATVNGIVLNPMQQSEPSKQGLFTNADYAWNIWETADKYDSVWHDSFNYIDHGTKYDTVGSAAYRELSKHMMNSAKLYNEESFEIKDQLKAFTKDLSDGKSIASQAAVLRAEFVKLQQAAKDYRTGTGNERTLGQIIYWIDCWDDTTESIINFLDCAVALENKDDSTAVATYLAGQESAERSRTHKFLYIDFYQAAKVGRLHITPFMGKLDQLLSAKVSTIIDPTKQIVSFITNRPDVPEGSLNNVFDNNGSTEIIFKNPSHIDSGTYVGVQYQLPIDVNKVIVRMGQANNPADNFTKAVLEYTTDGSEWKAVNDKVYNSQAEIIESNLNLKGVVGVRLRATEYVDNKWLGVRDFVVNPDDAVAPTENTTTLSTDKLTAKINSTDKVTDGNMGSYTHFAESPYKAPGAAHEDYIPVDATVTLTFARPRVLTSIHMKQDGGTDKLTSYAIEYSENGTEWKELKSYNGDADVTLTLENPVKAKAIRIRNKALNLQSDQKHGYWWKLYDFSFTEKAGSERPVTKEHVFTNTKADLGTIYTEERTELVAEGPITLGQNEYIGVDLTRIKDLASFDFAIDPVYDIDVEVSQNGVQWEKANSAEDLATKDARYVRVINVSPLRLTFNLERFAVNSNEIFAPSLYESTMGINNAWGVAEDSRNNGAAFDGNVDSTTEFADFPQKGQYIIYDLGQVRTIKSLEMFCQDSAVNYIRDADIEISNNLKDWTKVVTIGDGKQNTDDGGIKCIDSDAGYRATSKYPNKVSVRGEIAPQEARYVRITMTATNNSRAVLFNEIEINDGEYAPIANDPTFETTGIEKQGHHPQLMFDKDLTTSYMPASDKAGSITYKVSENPNYKMINILQKSISNAKVEALTLSGVVEEWKVLGTLDESFKQFKVSGVEEYVTQLRISWEDNSPVNISEIIFFDNPNKAEVNKDELQAEIENVADIKPVQYYTSESWNNYANAGLQAVRVVRNDDATQEQVDKALADLRKAKSELVLRDIIVVSYSITLTDKLDFNFYLQLNGEVKNDPEAYVEFVDMSSKSLKKFMISELTPNKDGLYKVSLPLYARQMKDQVVLITHSANGNYGTTHSMADYAVDLLDDSTTTPEARATVQAMLNYGAMAQIYFDYNTENLANEAVMDESYKNVTAEQLAKYAAKVSGSVEGIKYGTSNLRLLSETTIRHHFVVNEEIENLYKAGTIKFVKVTPDGEEALTPTFYGGNKVYVEVENIFAFNLDKAYTVKVVNTQTHDEIVVNYSTFSYAYEALTKSSNTKLQDLVKALVVYNQKAIAYKNSK